MCTIYMIHVHNIPIYVHIYSHNILMYLINNEPLMHIPMYTCTASCT